MAHGLSGIWVFICGTNDSTCMDQVKSSENIIQNIWRKKKFHGSGITFGRYIYKFDLPLSPFR